MERFDVEDEGEMLKGIFLPFISPSHLVPVVDIARIFAMHGVNVTIITTPANAAVFQSSIDRDSSRGRSIRTHVVKFPQIPGLPDGMETFNSSIPKHLTNKISEALSINKISEALSILEGQYRQLFHDMKPDFILSDMFYPWTVDVAAELGIPRLIYVGGTYFAHCAMDSLERFQPHTKVNSDDESFLIPGLPHKIEMTRSQIPARFKAPHEMAYIMKSVKESEIKSYGSLFKSFYAFEGAYEEHYRAIMGTKSWNLGPISSWVNQDASDKASRGHGREEQQQGCLAWLDSKADHSVIYVCFGSMNNFSATQVVEIAHALEDCGYDFIWVVRKVDEGEARGFVEEFEKRVQASNRGYLVWTWAPQLLILEHPAIGAVVTHCGMNTVIESVDAGLPMVTWPLFAEQFFNERLLVDVLKIGVPVGAKKWKNWNELGNEIVKREDIGKAIALLMDGGEESVEMRRRVKGLSDAAKKAIQVGGSSYNSMKYLIEELKSLKLQKYNGKVEEAVA